MIDSYITEADIAAYKDCRLRWKMRIWEKAIEHMQKAGVIFVGTKTPQIYN